MTFLLTIVQRSNLSGAAQGLKKDEEALQEILNLSETKQMMKEDILANMHSY